MSSFFADYLPIILIIIAVIAVQYFIMRGRRPEATQREIVINLLSEIRLDQAMLEYFLARKDPKRLMTTTYLSSKKGLGFLEPDLQSTIADAFTMVEEFNQQVKAAKKLKSIDEIKLDTGKLKELLVKSREGLESWFSAHSKPGEPLVHYPTVFDALLGRKR